MTGHLGPSFPPTTYIPAPAVLSCCKLREFKRLWSYLASCKAEGCYRLDLRGSTFVSVSAMLVLHHLTQGSDKAVVGFLPPQNEKAREYVKAFAKGAGRGLELNRLKRFRFPLRYVDDADETNAHIREWGQVLRRTASLDEETTRGFESTMSEVLANSFTHGKCQVALLGGQVHPQTKHSVLAASDNGCSIPESLSTSEARNPGTGRRLKDERRADSAWIELSMEFGVTAATTDSNRGWGLFHLREKVVANGGSVLIVSRRGIVHVGPDNKTTLVEMEEEDAFPGTLIVLDLKTHRSTAVRPKAAASIRRTA